MYGIFTYICLTFMVNVGKYTIHSVFGYNNSTNPNVQAFLGVTFPYFETLFFSEGWPRVIVPRLTARRRRRGKEERGRRQTTDIKSNNPHLTGGEKKSD